MITQVPTATENDPKPREQTIGARPLCPKDGGMTEVMMLQNGRKAAFFPEVVTLPKRHLNQKGPKYPNTEYLGFPS